jgi:hypothetical protein
MAIALAFPHSAGAITFQVQPQAFSPAAGELTVESDLGTPQRIGVRLVTGSGKPLGWLLPRALRRSISISWDGTLDGAALPQGYYSAQLVSDTRVMRSAPFRIDLTAPRLTHLRASNGGPPFAKDVPLLTTISPNGDGFRDSATVSFTLSEPAEVTLDVQRTVRETVLVHSETRRFPAGTQQMTWSPGPIAPRTYILRLTATDTAGNSRAYGPDSAFVGRFRRTAVVRVLGVDAAFTQPSYAPGQLAFLRIATDAPSLTMRVFRVGGEDEPTYIANEMSGLQVDGPTELSWRKNREAPAVIRFHVGLWRTGLYYAELDAGDGRLGYAPFVVRPAMPGTESRVAVVLPTTTWQAYNFYDGDGDGWGDTWYAGGRADRPVVLGRPFLNRGVPPYFVRYDIAFQTWLAREKKTVEFLAESDLTSLDSGFDLARSYDLVVFPGHTEYVTRHEFDVVEQYRDAGGNLIFLSANNFFWHIQQDRGTLVRTALWRDLGRPEAGLIGVQYRANDEGEQQGVFVARNVAAAPWLWEGTDVVDGSTIGDTIGGYGIEIDGTSPASPPGTIVLAEIPDLLGPGLTAQMAYYETPAGAKVFAAGALDFCGSVMTQPARRMLANLWARLSQP